MLDAEVQMRKADVDDLIELSEKQTMIVAEKISEENAEARDGDRIIQEKILETFEYLEEDILQHQQNRENYETVRSFALYYRYGCTLTLQELKNLIESVQQKFTEELELEEETRAKTQENMLIELEQICLTIDSLN